MKVGELKQKEINLKTYVISILIVAILVGLSVYRVYANGSSVQIVQRRSVTQASYILSEEGGTYYARNGANGAVISGTNLTKLLTSIIGSNTLISFEGGGFLIDSPIIIPDGTKCLTFKGISGAGKSYGEGGGYYGTHIKSTASVIFQTEYTNDKRSVFGLSFYNIKFEGPNTDSSIGIKATNVDGLTVEDCFFYKLGYSIVMDFQGTTKAEQPGYLKVRYNAFSEGRTEAITVIKSTQNDISHNIFWGWGPYDRYINLTGTDKTRIVANEFNYDSSVTDITEHISLKSVSGYNVAGIIIESNWAVRNSNFPFIRTSGNNLDIYDVISEGNIICHNYKPNIDTDSGPYIIGDEDYHQINARDHINPFSSQFTRLKDQTSSWTAGVTRQNKWSPMMVYVTVDVPNGGSAEVLMNENSTVWSIMSVANNVAATQKYIMTFEVPTLYYWRVNVAGGASIVSVIVCYW